MANTSVGLDAATTGTSSRADDEHVVVPGRGLGEWCRPRSRRLDLEVDELEAHLLGHAPHEVGFGHEAPRRQDPGDGLAGPVLLEDVFHLLERDALAFDQDPGQRREVSRGRRAVAIVGQEVRLLAVLFLERGHGLRHQVGSHRRRVGVWGARDARHRAGQFLELIDTAAERVAAEGRRIVGRCVGPVEGGQDAGGRLEVEALAEPGPGQRFGRRGRRELLGR